MAVERRDELSQDVIQSSKLPEVNATAYRHMYAHGMHFRMRDAEEEKVTCESAVASVVWGKKSVREFQDLEEIEMKVYVGWIQEILELNYLSHCCIVLVCSWVPATIDPTNNKVVCDKYGFSLANLHSTSTPSPTSFAFPTQCRQVFFSSDVKYSWSHGGDWRVVCGTDVRGRRGHSEIEKPEIEILNPMRDSDWEGLRIVD
jgi:hypothetical protein